MIDLKSLTPAFDGTRGWISVSELDAIDPLTSGFNQRFKIASKDITLPDGTVWVYAFPRDEPSLLEAPRT
jgi:hypothetical protein